MPLGLQAWADLMAGMSQEGAVPQDTAAAVEHVFHALVLGSLQDMATGAAEVSVLQVYSVREDSC